MPDYSQMSTDQLKAEIDKQAAGAKATPTKPLTEMSDQELQAEIQRQLAVPQPSSQLFTKPGELAPQPQGLTAPRAEDVAGAISGTEAALTGGNWEGRGQLAGGLAGSMLGPVAEAAGSGIGAGIGSVKDWLSDQSEGKGTLGSTVMGAATRGVVTSGVGQLVGRGASTITHWAIGNGPATTDPSIAARLEKFQKWGVTGTPGVITQRPGQIRNEMAVGQTAMGAGVFNERMTEMADQTESAIKQVLNKAAPGLTDDVAEMGQTIERYSKVYKRLGQMRNKAKYQNVDMKLADQSAEANATRIFNKWTGAMEQPSLKYETTSLQDALRSIADVEATQPELRTGARMANRAILQTEKTPTIFGGQTVTDPALLQQLKDALGVDVTSPQLSFQQIRDIQSNGKRLAAEGTNPRLQRAGAILGAAATEDIDRLMETNAAAKFALEKANTYYRDHYADIFLNSIENGTIKKTDYSQIGSALLRPKVSIESMNRLEELIGPRGIQNAVKAWQTDLIEQKSRVAGKPDMFSIEKYLTNTGPRFYSDDVLKKMFGSSYGDWKEVRDIMTDAYTAYKMGLNASGTGSMMSSLHGLQSSVKLGLFALGSIGTGSALVPANPIIGALVGATVPMYAAKAWFSKPMLKWWVEGINWSPTMRNAANKANLISRNIMSTMVSEGVKQQPDVEIQIDRPEPAAGSLTGYEVR